MTGGDVESERFSSNQGDIQGGRHDQQLPPPLFQGDLQERTEALSPLCSGTA